MQVEQDKVIERSRRALDDKKIKWGRGLAEGLGGRRTFDSATTYEYSPTCVPSRLTHHYAREIFTSRTEVWMMLDGFLYYIRKYVY